MENTQHRKKTQINIHGLEGLNCEISYYQKQYRFNETLKIPKGFLIETRTNDPKICIEPQKDVQ